MNQPKKRYRYKTPEGQTLRLEAASYQMRNPQTHQRPWTARAYIFEDLYDAGQSVTDVRSFWPHGSHGFASAEIANAAALRGAARWIDEGRPPLPEIGP